jgi:hypothetical protein
MPQCNSTESDSWVKPEIAAVASKPGPETVMAGVFGAKALIHRCRRHKERSVTDHLPEAERPLVQCWLLGLV